MSSLIGYSETTCSENKRKKKMYFLICESCFWCASASDQYFIKNETISRCPLCDDDRISTIPISRGKIQHLALT
jgi:hypothetical protein